ncbi:MAG: DUF4416 family protein [Nitrospirota bacterium]
MRRRKPTPPEHALLVIGALFADEEAYLEAVPLLEKTFGEVIMESPLIPWDFSSHYEEELGSPICRRFLFFKDLIDQGELSSAKLKTCAIENTISLNGKRTVNLDPGYLTVAKLVLASTKDYAHRIYIGKGVFAEVTLAYNKSKRCYLPLPNTYNDFKDRRYTRLFAVARVLLRSLQSEQKAS